MKELELDTYLLLKNTKQKIGSLLQSGPAIFFEYDDEFIEFAVNDKASFALVADLFVHNNPHFKDSDEEVVILAVATLLRQRVGDMRKLVGTLRNSS